MQMKRWAAAFLVLCLLLLCACAAEKQPYPQQTQIQTQDTHSQLLSEELPKPEETTEQETPDTPDEETEPVENEPGGENPVEKPTDNPADEPSEPQEPTTDEPQEEPEDEPSETPDPPADDPGDGAADDPADAPAEKPNGSEQPSNAAILPMPVPSNSGAGKDPEPEKPSDHDIPNNVGPAGTTEEDNTEAGPEPNGDQQTAPNNDGQTQNADKTKADSASDEKNTETRTGSSDDEQAEQVSETHKDPPEAEPDEFDAAEPEGAAAEDPENAAEFPADEPEKPKKSSTGWLIAFLAAALLAAAESVYICLRSRRSKKKEKTQSQEEPVSTTLLPPIRSIPQPDVQDGQINRVAVGKVHAQGARESQQDSFSVSSDALQPGGILAIVADGMGGLSDGDKVSQTIVSAVMHAFVSGEDTGTPRLPALLAKAKLAVDQLLGPDGLRQSGSTVVMGMIRDSLFEYLSVGDSRICLYRDGELYQLNRSHSFSHDLLVKAINGEKTFEEIRTDRRAECLTSYIGMGELIYVDIPAAPIKVHPGDVFILMSDGVFNALTNQELSAALEQDAEEAAEMIDQWIQKKNYHNQDNYTAVILQCCADTVHESPERN